MIAATNPYSDVFNYFSAAAQYRTTRSIRQFAEDEIVIPDGPFEGRPFRVDRQPWTGLLFDEIDNRIWPELVATAPAQSGKTLALFVIPLLWAAVELRCNCVVGLPDEEMWGDKWLVDILPVLRASPSLMGLIPMKGPGSRDGKPKEAITLGNGVILKPMTPSGGEHTRSGFTAPIVSVTELYRFTGSPFGELKARQGAFNRFDAAGELTRERRLWAEGTLTTRTELPWTLRSAEDEDNSVISTESEIQSPCPHCGEYVFWEREHLVGWEDAKTELRAARAACWRCPECDKRFDEAGRRESASRCRLVHRGQSVTPDGEVVGETPEVSRLFFRVCGYQNLLVNTSELGAEEWEAARIDKTSPSGIDREEYLATKKWAIPFDPPALDFRRLSHTWIRDNRCGQHGAVTDRNILPKDTVFYVTAVDIGYTCWMVSLAFKEDGTVQVVEFDSFATSLKRGDRSQPQTLQRAITATLHEIYDRLDEGLTQSSNGVRKRTDLVLVDSGFCPEAVFDVCIERNGLPVIGRGETIYKSRRFEQKTKTAGDVKMVGTGWYLSHVRKWGYWQLTVDADKSKLDFQHGLRVEPGRPGAIQIARRVGDKEARELCKHFAAEVRRREVDDKGKIIEVWLQSGRHDYLDAAGYAYVGGHYLGWSVDEPTPPPPVREDSHPNTLAGGRPYLATER